MHTSTELRSEQFDITVDGERGRVETVFPGFDEEDRLGIVIGSDWGAAGASTVILAAVTAFYDRLRARGPGFSAYPDFFAFHVGRPRGSLCMLDVYPEHKEIVVPRDPEQLVRAINDRGVTRLLVEERPNADEPAPPLDPGAPEPEPDLALEPWTRASAEGRIQTALAYSATGRLAGADVVVTGTTATESFVAAMLADTDDGALTSAAERMGTLRAGLLDGERPVETFVRIPLERALRSLRRRPGDASDSA